ncbi:hypothetical protein [Candidatus Foliamicus sp.]
MTLLDELRTLDVGEPARWSRRVCMMLAGILFLLVAVLGLRMRVFGLWLPRLEDVRADIAELERQLDVAHRAAGEVQTLGKQAETAEELLKATGVWLPLRAVELDLPVALATGWESAPLQAVRSWEPPTGLAVGLPRAGAEVELSGTYAVLAGFVDCALRSRQLRELIELNIESPVPETPGLLRASVRVVAHYGGSGAADLLRQRPEQPTSPAASGCASALADLPSPFSGTFAATVTPVEAQATSAPPPVPGRGMVRVGARSYELSRDAAGEWVRRSSE